MRNRVIFLLDESASMLQHADAAEDGYNEFVAKLQQANINAEMTTVLFNHVRRVLVDGVPVASLAPWHDYRPSGGTLLYDSIINTVQARPAGPRSHVPAITRGAAFETPEARHLARLGIHPGPVRTGPDEPRTLCVILTDGDDTDSYSTELDVRRVINQYTATGLWSFIWLAAGRHAARPTWINPGNLLDFEIAKLRDSMEKLARATVGFLQSSEKQTQTFFLTEGRP